MKAVNISLLVCALVFSAGVSSARADAGPTEVPLCVSNRPSGDATCNLLENTAHFLLAPDLIGHIDLISSEDYRYCSSCAGRKLGDVSGIIPDYRAYQSGQDLGNASLFAIPDAVFKKYFRDPSAFSIGVPRDQRGQAVSATTTYFNFSQASDSVYGNPLGTVYGLVIAGLKFATPSPTEDEHLAIYNSGRPNGFFDSSASQIEDETVPIASPIVGYDGTYTISQNKQGLLEIHQDSITTRFQDGSTNTEHINPAKPGVPTSTSTSTTTAAIITPTLTASTLASTTTEGEPISKSWLTHLWEWFIGLFS